MQVLFFFYLARPSFLQFPRILVCTCWISLAICYKVPATLSRIRITKAGGLSKVISWSCRELGPDYRTLLHKVHHLDLQPQDLTMLSHTSSTGILLSVLYQPIFLDQLHFYSIRSTRIFSIYIFGATTRIKSSELKGDVPTPDWYRAGIPSST